jgi:hypothetical protein
MLLAIMIMTNYFWMILSIFTVLAVVTTGSTNAQTDNASDKPTTAAVANLTNATTSFEDIKNMSVIEGTTNGTTNPSDIMNQTVP